MVTSPIGGFMPIPLAIMPPFMAYQSLLMGDAFGKGFQYGKRKMSAMTNEDFNKLNLPALFKDSMAEYESMIPTVESAMQNSTKLQNSIIEKMLKIIPELLATIFTGTGGTTSENAEGSPFLKNQTDVAQNATIQAMQATIQNIRYTTDRDPVFNEPAIEELQKQLDQLLEQRGTKDNFASSQEDKPHPELTPSPPPPPFIKPPPLTSKAQQEKEEITNWMLGMNANMAVFEKHKSNWQQTRNASHKPFYIAEMKKVRLHIVHKLRDTKPLSSGMVAVLQNYRTLMATGKIFVIP